MKIKNLQHKDMSKIKSERTMVRCRSCKKVLNLLEFEWETKNFFCLTCIVKKKDKKIK